MKNENIIKLRILATIFVVLGHAMIIYDPSWGIFHTERVSDFFLYSKQFINIFQMPIFMLIAGYLFYNSMKKGKYIKLKDLIIDKFKRLIIPFLFISFFWIVPIRLFVKYTPFITVGYFKSVIYVLIGKDSGHAWFLPTLFFIFILVFIFNKYIKSNNLVNIIIFIIFYLISYIAPSLFFINSILKYAIYFFIGYVFSQKNMRITFNFIFYVNLIIFAITTIISIFSFSKIVNVGVNLLAAISGTYVFYNCSSLVKINKLFEFLDKQSFSIYLFHSPVMYIIYNYLSDINPLLLVSLNTIISIIVSLCISTILRRINLGFLLGEVRK